MQFSQYIWSLYKESKAGRAVIEEFEFVFDRKEEYELFQKYCPNQAKFLKKDDFSDIAETLWCYGITELGVPTNKEEAFDLYSSLISYSIMEEGEIVISRGDYQTMLSFNTILSLLLYLLAPDFYYPNFFQYKFLTLNKIADTFNLELPKLPKKADYRGRCLYYWELCILFKEFRKQYNLNPSEMCAFLYDFAPSISHDSFTEIPKPSQAWFIGGKSNKTELGASSLFWQANPETKKGDILIHYEKSPISAINSIWIAQTDGVIDPFFHYYSNTYVANQVEIPPITIHQLKEDPYFKDNPLVRKNLQGVNGYPLSSKDYKRLLELLSEKGFNTEILPTLYSVDLPLNIKIAKEVDVETKLLEPLLEQMGLKEGKNYIKQLAIKAGRGHRIYPDYALHYDDTKDQEKAKTLIEAKFLIKNTIELHKAFTQARSYANLLEARKIILCDKVGLIIFEKKDSFDRDLYTKFYWNEFKDNQILKRFQDLIK